jgi:hypothetical protein
MEESYRTEFYPPLTWEVDICATILVQITTPNFVDKMAVFRLIPTISRFHFRT